ncbi:MAG: GNAT family N-acetyltransferase [Acidimicrobiales bacterium]
MQPVAVPAGTGDLEALGDVLQAAFFDDPVTSWFIPDAGSRPRRLARMFTVLLRSHYLPMRTVWTTGDQLGGALWAPPGHASIPTSKVLREAPAMLQSFGRHTARALRFLDLVEKQHPVEAHWYLGVLGTGPAHQGRGVGAALIQPVLEKCDRDGIPAYLESSKATNIGYYERFGFAVTGEITLRDGPTVWPMWRDPRPAAG